MKLIYFLGRLHVLVLHFPIVLALTAAGIEWAGRRERFKHLAVAVPLLWGATAISAIATVVLGYMHFAEGGFTGPSASAHRLLGSSVAVVATLIWVVGSRAPTRFVQARSAAMVLLLVLVTLTGHFGGNLTHGETFLLEYAPAPLQRLAGFEGARPPITDPALADPFLDVVQPMLSQRCRSCHNDDKRRGGLSFASYEALMKGGERGTVVVPGDPAKSDLYRRITLPSDHEDYMPKEGKTPLSEDQVAVLRWWIEAGAPTKVTLGKLQLPQNLEQIVFATTNGQAQAAPAASAASAAESTLDKALIADLAQKGFLARQRSAVDTHLMLSSLSPGRKLSVSDLEALAPQAEALTELNVKRSGLDDSALAVIGKFKGLTRLHLDSNQVSDRGVAALEGLQQLEYLNLYGNKGVTDQAVEAIAKLKGLETVFLWDTAVTERGAERLRRLRPELHVNMGDE